VNWFQPSDGATVLWVAIILALFVVVWLLFLGDTPSEDDDWDDDRIFDDDNDDGSRA
jgi:Ca2+/Na+ antiporter